MITKKKLNFILVLFCFLLLVSCDKKEKNAFQGYVEAEYLYIASPFAGRLDQLSVHRGQTVEANDPLFVLEHENEAAEVMQAEASLKTAQFQASDLKTGKREPELNVYRGQLEQAKAQQELSSLTLARDQEQFQIGAIAEAQLESSRATFQNNQGKVFEILSQIESGELPGRIDQRLAQKASVEASEALLAQARWKLSQKTLVAPMGGLIFDTLYVEGEWVSAGNPIVLLLSPKNIKIRFFVPEIIIGKLQPGQEILVHCDGCAKAVSAHISYISPEAEYTPPVIFSNETRSKLIFMIEASLAPEDAVLMHPGQPVTVNYTYE